MSPATRVKVARRAALRRRYGYAALRVLRRALRRALRDHRERELGQVPYSGNADAIGAAYWTALRALRRRWPNLDPSDERAEP